MGKHCPKDIKINAVLFQNNSSISYSGPKNMAVDSGSHKAISPNLPGKPRRGKVRDEEFRQQAKIC